MVHIFAFFRRIYLRCAALILSQILTQIFAVHTFALFNRTYLRKYLQCFERCANIVYIFARIFAYAKITKISKNVKNYQKWPKMPKITKNAIISEIAKNAENNRVCHKSPKMPKVIENANNKKVKNHRKCPKSKHLKGCSGPALVTLFLGNSHF